MTEKLPISIDACAELQQQFVKICSVCNKLEAQFNFQTMMANWYGDENNMLAVQLHLLTPENFSSLKNSASQGKVTHHSDDVFSDFEQNTNQASLTVYIAITAAELILLSQQAKVLTALLNVKLQKVLNLVAQQLKLTPI
mgnify:CR=1 FL=1